MLPVPPPSPELLAIVRKAKPVRTRVPLRAFAITAALGVLFVGIVLLRIPLRRDLPGMPLWWFALTLPVWMATYFIPLAMAMLPRRQQVLPDPVRAGRAALLTSIAIVIAMALCVHDVPGSTLIVHGASVFWHAAACIVCMLIASLGPLLLALVALRRLVLSGAWRIGAAAGAAGGGLAGLLIHLQCDVGGRFHAAFSHGLGVSLCALVGAIIGGIVLRRRAT